MKLQDPEQISLLINLSIASAKLRFIKIKENDSDYNMRPQIHIILAGSQGSCKSTILTEVARHFNNKPVMEFTDASMVGSIEKELKRFVPGASWEFRNSILPLDEFEFTDRSRRPVKVIGKLLSLSEGEQYFQKRIGIFSQEFNEKDGDLFCKCKNGVIEVKSNFALLIGTMDGLSFFNTQLLALKSRCIPIKWEPGWDVLLNIAHGNPIFRYYDYSVNFNDHDHIVISNKDYNKILNIVKDKIKKPDLFLRTLGDLCRVFAIIQKHDLDLYDLIIKLKST